MKRKLGILAALLVCCTLIMPARTFARELPDMERAGSITLTLENGGVPLTGGVFELFLVGEIAGEDGNLEFAPSANIAGYTGRFDHIESSAAAQEIWNYVTLNSVPAYTTMVNTDGTVVFRDLRPGLYLVAQKESSGEYQGISPFLVSVPRVENGTYLYDVDAAPKIGTVIPVTTPGTAQTTPRDPGVPGYTTTPEVPGYTTTPEVPGYTTTPEVPGYTTTPGTPGYTTTPYTTVPPAEQPEPTLPQTGQLNWPVPVLTCAGLVLFVFGWTLRFTKKNEDAQ